VNERLIRWAQTAPRTTPTPVHGDYRFDNCVLDADMRVAAVLDWEMSTVGDPLCDLGMLLVYWSEPGSGAIAEIGLAEGITAHPGFPGRREVVERYALLTGRDVSDIAMYAALGYYKLAAILQGIYARHRSGLTVGEGFDHLGSRVPHLLTLALDHADRTI
jgi:aminoglycoside phosphotransferase (APT) family kinase protein